MVNGYLIIETCNLATTAAVVMQINMQNLFFETKAPPGRRRQKDYCGVLREESEPFTLAKCE